MPSAMLEAFDIDGKTLGSVTLQNSRWWLRGDRFINVDNIDIKILRAGIHAGVRFVVDGQIKIGSLCPTTYGNKVNKKDWLRMGAGQIEISILNATKYADNVNHFLARDSK